MLVFGGLLIIAGAVLSFAVREKFEAFDVTILGYILMAGGLLMILLAAFYFMPRSRRIRSTSITTDQAGRQAVVERDDRISDI